MQQQLELTGTQQRFAKELTNNLRQSYRESGVQSWYLLDWILQSHRRFQAIQRDDASFVMRHGWYEGDFRLHIHWRQDPSAPDGYAYWILLRQHLLRNRNGE